MTPAAEFNIWADPEAAAARLRRRRRVTMIGLDVTHQRAARRPRWPSGSAAPGRVGTFVAELVEFFQRTTSETYGWDGAPIHDAVARRAVFRPGLVDDGTANVEVDCGRSSGAAGRWSTSAAAPGARRTPTSASDIDSDRVRRAAARAARDAVMLVFAAIAPHGAPALDDRRRDAAGLEELGRRFDAAEPDATIVFTPHGVLVEDHFAVALAAARRRCSAWSDPGSSSPRPATRRSRANASPGSARTACLPSASRFGDNARRHATMPLDWGALIPLGSWAATAPVVVVSPAREPIERLVEHGAALGRVARESEKRIAVIASADHGHAHDADGRTASPAGRPTSTSRSWRSCARTASATCSGSSRLRRAPRSRTAGGRWRCSTARSVTRGRRAAVVRGADVLRHALRRVCAFHLSRCRW